MSKTTAGHRIELSTGDWITIRPKRGWEASNRIQASGAKVTGVDADGNPAFALDLVAYGMAVLEHAILAWSLDGEPGSAAFLSDDFDADLGDEMVKAIDAYYKSQRRGPQGK